MPSRRRVPDRRLGGPLTKAMKKVASDTLAKRKVEIAENKFLDKKTQPICTFPKLARLYLEWAKAHHRGVKSDEYRVRQFEKYFGSIRTSEITPLKIDALAQERSGTCKSGTVNREMAVLRGMFTKAIEWGLATENPVQHFRNLHVEDGRCRYLTDEESERLFGAAGGTLYSLIQVALNTRMRRGEIFRLKWKEVDFQNGVVRVVDSKNGESREISMNETLRTTLNGIPRRFGSVFVFPGRTGEHLIDVRKGFQKALEDAQIDDFRFHDLRHTFASRLVMVGGDLVTVRELLGHKDIKMTLRYSHLSADNKASTVQLLDAYMGTKASRAVSMSS